MNRIEYIRTGNELHVVEFNGERGGFRVLHVMLLCDKAREIVKS